MILPSENLQQSHYLYNAEANVQKLTKKLFEVFDYTLSMVYKSLTEISYPKFVQSDIGLDLRQRLSMNIESRNQGFH